TIYIKNINFKLINKVEWIYSKTLKYFIRRHLITKILVLVLIILTLLALKFIPVSFSSPEIDNKILLTAEMSGNTSMDKLLEARDEINRIILQNPTVINTTYRVGANRDDMDFYGNPVTSSTTIYGTIYIDEKMIKNKENLIKNIENSITFNNIKIKLFESQDSIGKLLKMGNTKYSWSIYSRDQETLQNINWSAVFPNSSFFPTGSNSVISSVPNLRMLSNIGVTPKIILEFIRSYISGLYLGELEIDKSFTPIKIIHKDFNMLSVTDLSDLILPLGGNRSIRIGDYVNFKVIEQNKALLRLNKKDSIIIKSNELLNFNSLKDDYNLEVISNNDSVIYEKSREILYIFALALLFLFLFLVIQFESFKAPLLILLSLPLSIPGVFLAIIISKNSINITSSLGLLTLFGITVNSSIILKEKSNTLLKRGKNVVYSSFISSLERLKPILATSLTTVFSLLPIAFQLFGSNTQSGMAWVIIGGMFSSTILSLYLIPILSMRFYEKE
ncbi:MAG: efflux RND transporter permease subunit, partial [Spirochaetales bacterium]|nr:efflux RND transporter permease subunit [Spirochaetales bacterium]